MHLWDGRYTPLKTGWRPGMLLLTTWILQSRQEFATSRSQQLMEIETIPACLCTSYSPGLKMEPRYQSHIYVGESTKTKVIWRDRFLKALQLNYSGLPWQHADFQPQRKAKRGNPGPDEPPRQRRQCPHVHQNIRACTICSSVPGAINVGSEYRNHKNHVL